MKKLDVESVMDGLRKRDWLVVLKVMPADAGYVIEGSRSEYDAPCPDRTVGQGKWCCEITDMGWVKNKSAEYRHPVFSMGDSCQEAISKLLINLSKEDEFRAKRRANQVHL